MRPYTLPGLAAGCLLIVTALAHGQVEKPVPRRFHVFRCPQPERLRHASHVVVTAPVPPRFRAGVLPLRHREGITAVWDRQRGRFTRTARQLAALWGEPARHGYHGISIDEFGLDSGGQVDQRMAEALRLTRQAHQRLFIVVWHSSRPLSPVLLDAYRRCADLVVLECYYRGPDTSASARRTRARVLADLALVRRHGLAHRTVLAVGISAEYADTAADVRAQISWARRHAPDLPGLGIYARRGGDARVDAARQRLAEYADSLLR